MINIDSVVETYFPKSVTRKPLLSKPLVAFLRMLFHEKEFKQFEQDFPHIEGIDFVEHVLDYFNFSYSIRSDEIERISPSGRLVIVANHPIGSLDGLALLKLIYSIRRDVKVVGNQVLSHVEPLESLLLPVDNMNRKTAKANVKAIDEHLQNEGAVIIFPAGEVSRFGPSGIKDGSWNSGFLKFASKANAPILPLFIDGKNSTFFYSLSLIAKPISTLWLIREMFKQAQNHVDIRIGKAITHDDYIPLLQNRDKLTKKFKRHVYDLGKKKKPKWATSSLTAIAHPESRADLAQEIRQCEKLGTLAEDKEVFLYQYKPNSAIMREIGRLREISFRAVGEGSGKRLDIDHFDRWYDHLILWDQENHEIIGAYRMRQTHQIQSLNTEVPSLYTQTLFNFNTEFDDKLPQGLELGRSFIQPKYWNKRNLDILWYGIGAYLNRFDHLRYMFGPVTLSDQFPDFAKDEMVSFYQAHFSSDKNLASAKLPYQPGGEHRYQGEDYKAEFKELKAFLTKNKLAVPTLYKQYSELCEPGGVNFLAFNIDPDFSNCVDGLVLVDLEKVKQTKRKRYLGENKLETPEQAQSASGLDLAS